MERWEAQVFGWTRLMPGGIFPPMLVNPFLRFLAMTDITPFDTAEEGTGGFEDFGHDNGTRWWWQSDLRDCLGYESGKSFDKAVGRAIAACTALGISVPDNFKHDYRTIDDEQVADCRLSRFACMLIAMNGDPTNPIVAKAQAYFLTWAEAARQIAIQAEHVERVVERDELARQERSLAGTAKGAGVSDYALFQNAGYRGLYNMNFRDLRVRRGVPDGRTILDFMGREELAANLFRITQTDSKIRREKVRGQHSLERAAEDVGRHVRKTIRDLGGVMPENLPLSSDIKVVKSDLKKTKTAFEKQDKKRLPKPKKEKTEDG